MDKITLRKVEFFILHYQYHSGGKNVCKNCYKYIGYFHNFGIINGESSVILEIEKIEEMEKPTSNETFSVKRVGELINLPISLIELRFLD